jgi:voltage-gated potassium channel Kch
MSQGDSEINHSESGADEGEVGAPEATAKRPGANTSAKPFVIVAGFGLPGRSLVELLRRSNIEYLVVELNPQTCQRVAAGGMAIVCGDAGNLEVLKSAGVEKATMVALMVPSEAVVLSAVSHVRKLNPTAHIIARCAFTSSGLEAVRRGANETIVAEQVVSRELDEMASKFLKL